MWERCACLKLERMNSISQEVRHSVNNAIKSVQDKKEEILRAKLFDLGLIDRIENPDNYEFDTKQIFSVNYMNQYTEYRFGTKEDYVKIVRFYPISTVMDETGLNLKYSFKYD